MREPKHFPVHRMDDWVWGVYVKPASLAKSTRSSYAISQPHRHDFYYCMLVDKGEIELEVDFQKIQLTDQSLFLSYPGQIHQVHSVRVERGWFLAFDPAILDEALRDVLEQRLSEVILLPVSPEQSTRFFTFITHLYSVYKEPAPLFGQPILQSLVAAFVYELASAYLVREKVDLIRHSSRSIEITKTFKRLLRRHYRSLKRPSDYAAEMNITVSYLNDTVRSVTGFPVTYYIQQALMREAKQLLVHTDLAIKEIADNLGFEDVAYFNRLFRKVTGVSPGAFRRQSELPIRL